MSTLPYSHIVDPVALLSQLVRRKALLRLSHPFRGVVLTQDLSLVSLSPDRALVQLASRWLPANPGDHVFLHSPESDEVLVAQILAVNIQSGELTLGKFSLIDRAWIDRMHERVQPSQPVHAVLRHDDRAMRVSLENLSIKGAGVLAYKLPEHGFDLSPGKDIILEFELPQMRARLALPSQVMNIRYHGGHLASLGLHTLPNNQQARTLERAINQRKVEIMQELDQVYYQTFQPQSVKELYF
jgi:hypothetical protein